MILRLRFKIKSMLKCMNFNTLEYFQLFNNSFPFLHNTMHK